MTRLTCLLALTLAPLPALSQDAAEADRAIRDFARMVETGDLKAGTTPSTKVTAEGCAVSVTTYNVSPEIDVPLQIVSDARADRLDFDGWVTDPKDGRLTLMFPAEGPAGMAFDLRSRDTDVQDTFAARLPNAACDPSGCTAEMASPGLAFALYDQGMEEAEAVRTALRSYGEHCAAAGRYPIVSVPDTAPGETAFQALSSALTTGAPGEVGASSVSRGEGCAITYTLSAEMDGLKVDGVVEIDVSALDPHSARIDNGQPLNIFYDGTEGFYSATVTADVAQAEQFEALSGEACSAEACSATRTTDWLYLTLVGDDAQERAARTIAAMKAFHASCTE